MYEEYRHSLIVTQGEEHQHILDDMCLDCFDVHGDGSLASQLHNCEGSMPKANASWPEDDGRWHDLCATREARNRRHQQHKQ